MGAPVYPRSGEEVSERWVPVGSSVVLLGACDIIARIDPGHGRYWLHIGGRHGSLVGETYPSLSAAKRAGRREMRRLMVETRNEANSDAIDCDEWLRVNR